MYGFIPKSSYILLKRKYEPNTTTNLLQSFRKPSFRFSKQYSTFKPVISKSKGLYISLKNYKYSTPKSSIPTLLQRCIASLNPALPLLTEKWVSEKSLHFIKITHYYNSKPQQLLCRENLLINEKNP